VGFVKKVNFRLGCFLLDFLPNPNPFLQDLCRQRIARLSKDLSEVDVVFRLSFVELAVVDDIHGAAMT